MHEPNQRARNLQALRGSEGATDLRKIVLPPAVGIDNPDPAQIATAGGLMGLDGSFDLSLETLIGRQGSWTRGKGVTPEMLEAAHGTSSRRMVEARKKALARLLQARTARSPARSTVERAVQHRRPRARAGRGSRERGARARDAHLPSEASGMHLRLAKMLGIKPKK